MDFSGRTVESYELEKCYSSGGCSVVVCGRRRIGTTSLLEKFSEDRDCLILKCRRGGDAANLECFSEILSDHCGTDCTVDSYTELFARLSDLIRERKLAIAFDGIQRILSPDVSLQMQRFIDNSVTHSKSMLILCGTVGETVDRDFAANLSDRCQKTIELQSLPFDDTKAMHPQLSEPDALKLHLTLGGVPGYHLHVSGTSLRDCITGLFSGDGPLSEETENLIGSEISNPCRALAVLSAIGRGSGSLKDIASVIGTDATLTHKCLCELEEKGFVTRLHPMYDAPKRAVYTISDNLVDFCCSVLRGNSARQFNQRLEERMELFLQRRFVYFCTDMIRDAYPVRETGTWWSGSSERIDIISSVSSENVEYMLFCDCSFGEMGIEALDALIGRTDRFGHIPNRRFLLFSLTGFSKELEAHARKGEVLLIGPGIILGHDRMPKL